MVKSLWYCSTKQDVIAELKSNEESGLGLHEVTRRQHNGLNVIESTKRNRPLLMFISQFTDTMVLVLLGATVISSIVGAIADAMTILAIVIINAILGFIQEYRAERSLEQIKKLASPYANVMRDGQKIKIMASDLVPGDIVFLDSGDRVPADIRLLETSSMEIDEAILTGESLPVEKKAEMVMGGEVPLADIKNMVFMGTAVSRGRAKGVVVTTGMRTAMGEIADLIQDTKSSSTPLQIRLDKLGKMLISICLVVCAGVTVMGIYRGENVLTMFMAGISLAVAAIPEGLPAIVTVVLALGVQRMARRNAIVRKLPAVETLGCTTIICSDKTGTLTQNKMEVKRVATMTKVFAIKGEGYNPEGKFYCGQDLINPLKDMDLRLLLEIAFNCNNAELTKNKYRFEIQGDPTEGALLVMARRGSIKQPFKRLREIPFDAERKRMSVLVEINGECWAFTKGALDILINLCSNQMVEGKIRKLTGQDREKLMTLQDKWASQAFRVLALAGKKITREEVLLPIEQIESSLVIVGMCGMIDPPRPGVERAVMDCWKAGIVPVMITGDHPSTARAIAAEIGIIQNEEVVTGMEIDRLTDERLYDKIINNRVFARVSPQHKNRIVKVLKKNRHIVAMTGDGVNDAPAVKSADIGITMGISGTDVTKEASAMILADDDFSTIVSAVYEGRAIYDNIRKFIRYLLGCNIGEVLVMFLASLLGMPLPLLPIQILWVNLITDGLPAMALGLEPAEPGIMERRPRPSDEGIFSRGLGWTIFSRGIYIALITLASFTVGMVYSRINGVASFELARSMALTTLVLAQLFYVFECRSEKYSPFELGFTKNRFLLLAVLCSMIMQLSVLYIPFLQNTFKTFPLDLWQWLLIIALCGPKLIWKYILYTWQRLFASRLDYVKINA